MTKNITERERAPAELYRSAVCPSASALLRHYSRSGTENSLSASPPGSIVVLPHRRRRRRQVEADPVLADLEAQRPAVDRLAVEVDVETRGRPAMGQISQTMIGAAGGSRYWTLVVRCHDRSAGPMAEDTIAGPGHPGVCDTAARVRVARNRPLDVRKEPPLFFRHRGTHLPDDLDQAADAGGRH